MKYKRQPSPASYLQSHAASGAVSLPVGSVSVPSVSGAIAGQAPARRRFLSWQPSTWPAAPKKVDPAFIDVLRQIFDESILGEIGNVVSDATQINGDLQHRGHVVAIALMCALDAIASYGYRRKHIKKFVEKHFPQNYRPHAPDLYGLYRNSLVHSWNLFEAAILPGKERIKNSSGTLSFGLLNFFEAFQIGVGDFLIKLATDTQLQTNTLNRYRKLKKSARP